MKKLYNRISGALHYYEAWVHEGLLTVHWGKVGEKGQTKGSPVSETIGNDEEVVEKALAAARADGFQEIPAEKQTSLWIEYEFQDLDFRNDAEWEIDQCLGWTGLGRVEGSSIGMGSMDVSFDVVDFKIAKNVIEEHLKGTEFGNYSRIWEVDYNQEVEENPSFEAIPYQRLPTNWVDVQLDKYPSEIREEQRQRILASSQSDSVHAYRKEEYERVVDLLLPFEAELSKKLKKLLNEALAKI